MLGMTIRAGSSSSSAQAELKRVIEGIKNIKNGLPEVMTKLTPEFGAYMHYSYYLETGHTHPSGRMSIRARPHIVPAVIMAKRYIIDELQRAALEISLRCYHGDMAAAEKDAERGWIRALNDMPRRIAVEETKRQQIYEFGFHRRSIRGYALSPQSSEVRAKQQQAMAERRAKMISKRGKGRK